MRVWIGPLAWEPSFAGGSNVWRIPGGIGTVLDFRPLAECGTPGPIATPSKVVMVTPDAIDLTLVSGEYEQIASDPHEVLNLSQRQALKALTGSTAPLTALRLAPVLYELLTEHADADQVRTIGPLLPSSQRQIRLNCGPIAWARAFHFAGPEWPLIREALRRQYRILRLRALAGQILQRDPQTGEAVAVTDFHRRFLTVLLERFGLAVTAANASRFIPDDLEPEDPLPHDTSISDNFDGGDSGTLGKQLTWTETAGVWSNTSNRAQMDSTTHDDKDARAESDLSSTDHQTDIQGITVDVYWGACCRFDSGARTYMVGYRGFGGGGTTNSAIEKVVTGTRTNLTGNGTNSVANDTIRLKCEGTDHTLSVVGGSDILGPFSDSSITTGTRAGIFGFQVALSQQADNFAAADLVVTLPPAPPYAMTRTHRPALFAPGHGR